MPDYRADVAKTEYVESGPVTFAYRRLGPSGGVPLVLCMRFRGTIDHWDPAFLDEICADREVIIFDNAGVGFSSGTVPASIGEMALGALDFIDALGLTTIDLMGWSMGGFVAQSVALTRPGLVRRLIVAGSNPGKVDGAPRAPQKTLEILPKPVNDDDDFLYLFFPETPSAQEAGRASLRRLEPRLASSGISVSPGGGAAQLGALLDWSAGKNAAWDRLHELTMPVLVANGAHDVMTHAYHSYAMSQRLPDGKVVLYANGGHGFLFQFHEDFAGEVNTFLS
ncbi:alpha/beta fold hydrolase [Amycolatopsis granulosa]|uniref:alpha/beta fold hydrolase n=1 Tax=Amycolatopsis granulosa TaxID=185684 RepID=UPI001421EEEF|nr:alpha/beta hydrolase [Amycolatopsis granulosa]NIH83811.1 pimeloyl-ACP methyl ester carboxylesterase [Amycolatopsis granulosa]